MVMNNRMVNSAIQDCQNELNDIETIIQREGALSSLAKYLTRYALIRISGTFEFSYKNLIADYYTTSVIEPYLTNTIRDSSSNASIENIHKLLKSFDETKNDNFKNSLNGHDRNKSALKSLNSWRNDFAHGKSINVSFSELKQYFSDSILIFENLDSVLV